MRKDAIIPAMEDDVIVWRRVGEVEVVEFGENDLVIFFNFHFTHKDTHNHKTHE